MHWKVLDIAHTYYDVFGPLKNALEGHRFRSREDIKEVKGVVCGPKGTHLAGGCVLSKPG
jgi:hypothetical protein